MAAFFARKKRTAAFGACARFPLDPMARRGTVLAAAALIADNPKEAAMRIRTYRDEAYSRHFDLIGGAVQPWSVDLVSVSASTLLAVGFVCALLAQLVH